MARLGSINSNLKKQKLVKSHATKRRNLKDIIRNREVSMNDRLAAIAKLAELPRNGAAIRVRNRCLLTGRPRGYHRRFKISRIALREMGAAGQIPGLVKASW